MIQLPKRLEQRLEKLFSHARNREQFVKEAIERALDEFGATGTEHGVQAVGGTLHLFADGGSRGNPGQAAVGFVLTDPLTGKILREHGEAIGIHTNNVAEYRALRAGLEAARAYHPNRLVCHLDSELIVKQLSGEYRVKHPSLQPLLGEIHELTSQFRDVGFVHISRSENTRADRLVNEALDGIP